MIKEFKPNTPVLARMAEVFLQNNIIKKTHLHFASRTDWNSFEKYLKWLLDKNYIIHHGSNEHTYQLTTNGRDMFNMILNIHDNIKKFRSIISV